MMCNIQLLTVFYINSLRVSDGASSQLFFKVGFNSTKVFPSDRVSHFSRDGFTKFYLDQIGWSSQTHA